MGIIQILIVYIYFLLAEFNKITFQNSLPSPAVASYQTSGKGMVLNLNDNTYSSRIANEYELLFKPVDELSYNHIHFTVPTRSISLTLDTSKDYEVLIAYLNTMDGMPGHFERIACTL